MSKPKLGHVVLGGCEGCYVSLLDAHEQLVELAGAVDIVASPLVEKDDLRDCDVLLVEGAVTTEHDIEVLKEARAASKLLVAVGSCAALGGIGGLRNLYTKEEILEANFGDPKGPGENLPELTDRVRPISDIVDVDISVPGCAPKTATLMEAVTAALNGEEWEMPRRNMCDECSREKKILLEHSGEFVSDSVYALMELDEIDPDPVPPLVGTQEITITGSGFAEDVTLAFEDPIGIKYDSVPSKLDWVSSTKITYDLHINLSKENSINKMKY